MLVLKLSGIGTLIVAKNLCEMFVLMLTGIKIYQLKICKLKEKPNSNFVQSYNKNLEVRPDKRDSTLEEH